MTQTDKKDKNMFQKYAPLIALTSITALAALAVTYSIEYSLEGGFMDWMHYFMGFFLCCFAMLKIFNISQFAEGFQRYDLIAKKSRAYALCYPFIELALGLGYLSFLWPAYVYGATIVVMVIGTVGVILALRKGLNINCPCMGSALSVPLSTVTLTEDIAMGLMAGYMLFDYVYLM
jgi:hypothetical protein